MSPATRWPTSRTGTLTALLAAFLLGTISASAQDLQPDQPVRVLRKDGGSVTGVLVEQTDTHIEVRTRFGSMRLPLEDVAEIQPLGDPPAAAEQPAEETSPEQSVQVLRKDGGSVTGVLVEQTDTHIEVRTRFGSMQIPLDDVAEIKPLAEPLDIPDPSAQTPEEQDSALRDAIEEVLDLLADREILDAQRRMARLLKEHSQVPLLHDEAEQARILAARTDAHLHEEVVSFGLLSDYIDVLAESACPACGGAGSKRCRLCHGKGHARCTTCKGKGQVKCEDCRGEGKHACTKCGGTGRMLCDDCGPHDEVCCPHSKPPKYGLLRRYRPYNDYQVNNEGRGENIYVDCPECRNDGTDTCDTCDTNRRGMRTGYLTCRTCQGEKTVRCPSCHGRGELASCPACHGKKSSPCPRCAGTGEKREN